MKNDMGGKRVVMSPEMKANERRRSASSIAMAQQNLQEKTELQHYLNAMNLEDLERLTRERHKSTKNLENGPVIYGQKSPYGKIKYGNSVPMKVIAKKDAHEFGMGSYHKKDSGNVKTVLQNDNLRE